MNVVYVPWGKGIDEMITYGAAWLHEQSGDKLVLLAAKMIYQRNPLLPRLTVGAKVAAPSTLSRLAWRGGPVFAPWPDEKVLSVISDQLGERVTAVCLLPWGEDPYAQAWLAAHQAVNLINGQTQTPRDDLLSPVVTVAMEGLSSVSRHNGLDRNRAIGMLLALVSAGYRFEVNALVAWALTVSPAPPRRICATTRRSRWRVTSSAYGSSGVGGRTSLLYGNRRRASAVWSPLDQTSRPSQMPNGTRSHDW